MCTHVQWDVREALAVVTHIEGTTRSSIILFFVLQNDKTGLPSTELSDAAFDAAVAKPKTFRLSETNGLFALTNAPQGETDGKGLSLVDILKKRPGENEALEEIPRGFSPSRGKRHHYRDVPYVNWIVNHLLTLRKNMSNSYQRNRFNFGNSRGPKRSKFAPPRGFSISRGK